MVRKVAKRARDKPPCAACGGSGKNSRGNECVCVKPATKRPPEPAPAKPRAPSRRRKAPEMVVTGETLGEPIVESFLPEDDPPPKPEPTPKKKRKRRGKKATWVYAVAHHAVESRRLVSIETDDPLWMNIDTSVPVVHAYPENEDAIVRIRPPHDASDKAIQIVEAAVNRDGAYAIKLEPRAAGPAVVVKGKERKEKRQKMTQRKRVATMVSNANSKDIEALAVLCTEVMDEEGL